MFYNNIYRLEILKSIKNDLHDNINDYNRYELTKKYRSFSKEAVNNNYSEYDSKILIKKNTTRKNRYNK